jgi:hypothetical protein
MMAVLFPLIGQHRCKMELKLKTNLKEKFAAFFPDLAVAVIVGILKLL